MRIDFNVLWVDDQPSSVDAQIRRITQSMATEGFNFKPTKCGSMQEVESRISTQVFTDEIDLILVDWDLGAGVKGQDAIAAIRQRIQYRDVVFYSAKTEPSKLRELAYQAGLEGVFCTDRTGLPEEVIGVFESLVKKVLDLDHTRGIVMGATSDIDQMINDCVAAVHMGFESNDQVEMVDAALGIIQVKLDDLSQLFKKLGEKRTMTALLKAHLIFTSADRLKLLSRLLEKETSQSVPDQAKEKLAEYLRDVMPVRNKLGHKVLLPEGGFVVASVDGSEHVTLDQMRDLRRKILVLRGEFLALHAALQSGAAYSTNVGP